MFLRVSWLRIHTSSGAYITWEDAGENQAEISSSGRFYGDQQPTEAEYDNFCKHCWTKGTQPWSEKGVAEEDSGSSSTDA